MSRKKRSEEKRKNIRHSAYLCFRQNGYYQTSIDDICAKAEISKGSLYWYYGAKIDIFIDILETWAREVIDELLEQFEAAAKNPNRIHLLGDAFEQEFHRARAIVPLWVEFSLLGRTDKEVQISIGKFFRRARSAIAEILRATAYQHLSEGEIKATSGIILGSYMGIILQEYADEAVRAEEWAQEFVGILRLIFTNKHTAIRPKEERLPQHRLESILKDLDIETRTIFLSVRKELFSINPDLKERWIQGWNCIGLYQDKLISLVKIQPSQVQLKIRTPLPSIKKKVFHIQDKTIVFEKPQEWNKEQKSLLHQIFGPK